MTDYIRDLRPPKWDLGVRLHGINPEPLVHFGSKADISACIMSVLPSKADIAERNRHVRGPPAR